MPKILESGERQLVLKVKQFCESEKRNKAPIIPSECVRQRNAVMTDEAFFSITQEEWMKECSHVETIEDKYFSDGVSIDHEIDRFVIEVGGDSETSDDGDLGDSDSSTISAVGPLEDLNYFKK
ncbi:hypothetical protein ACJJTC_016222 [Scirpophaga incertulas]